MGGIRRGVRPRVDYFCAWENVKHVVFCWEKSSGNGEIDDARRLVRCLVVRWDLVYKVGAGLRGSAVHL